MEFFTKDASLKEKESVIKNLIKNDNKVAQTIFYNIYHHFLLEYEMQKSNQFTVFCAIYVNDINVPAWKLANHCNVSRTTLFNYRNDIIKYFETCLDKKIYEQTPNN